jgi:hypothetical protein
LLQFKTASDLSPDSDAPFFLSGMVYKLLGETKKSITYFKHVLDSNPNHKGATREIRLYMAAQEKGSGGLFSFGKKR